MRQKIGRTFLILGWLIISLTAHAQVQGTIVDEFGEALPFTNVYVLNTTRGTSSNEQGQYKLLLERGAYSIAFQHLGYKTLIKEVVIDDVPIFLDVQLAAEAHMLTELVLRADAEDPAYRVIREAQRKRKFHRDRVKSFSCQVYVKGNQKILDAPKSIFGFEIGDLDGNLDSNRQGIVYLSESISELHFSAPDDYKEVVISSKYSGKDRGYSFNSAKEMQFDFYENTVTLSRPMVSPIADNAMTYYKYELLGTFYDEEHRLINKIKVIPRRDTDPVYYGSIYIVEDSWNIYAVELGATAKATQVYFVDSLMCNQVFLYIPEDDVWRIFSNTIKFNLSGFGFKFTGQFSAIYSDYDLNPEFERKFFNRVVHEVLPESNRRDSSYWETIRPVPLTDEEKIDYVVKDSIRLVRESPAFKDSIDRHNNRFHPGNLIGGYNYSKTKNLFFMDVSSPLSDLSFNTVQGWNSSLALSFRKYYDEDYVKRILFGANMNYGFAERRLRVNGYFTYRPTRMKPHQWQLRVGRVINQINEEEPISSSMNMFYSLFVKENYAKFYEKDYIELNFTTEIAPGVVIAPYAHIHERRALVNNSDYSIFKKDRSYSSNDALNPLNEDLAFDPSRVIKLGINSSIRFGQRYTVFPDRRFSSGAKGPHWQVSYQYVKSIDDTDIAYQRLSTSLSDQYMLGVAGEFKWWANGGVFFGRRNMEIVDYRHFLGNEIFFAPLNHGHRSFLLLPYYGYSTPDHYLQMHLEHNFNGFILGRMPALSKLGWSLVSGAKYLRTGGNPDHAEFHIGVDKIGFSFVRLLRLDFAWAPLTDIGMKRGIRLRIGM